MLPDDKILVGENVDITKTEENLDLTTEVVKVPPFKVAEGLLAYLRSVLLNKNYDGPDKKYVMVSSPRVISFELMVLDFAAQLLKAFAKTNKGFKSSTIREDQDALAFLTSDPNSDPADVTVLEYNIQTKKVHHYALKNIEVMKQILLLIRDQKEPITSACFKKIPKIEDKDTIQEVFERRMGLSKYFKDLRMNLPKIEKMKAQAMAEESKEATPKVEKKKAEKKVVKKEKADDAPKPSESSGKKPQQ